jgi:RNA polymerase sigma factor, sigma-70 family
MKREESAIYDECYKVLYFTALRILNDHYEAEEVMHDTLLKYFRKKPIFDTTQERNAWMKRVCINLAIDTLRKKKRVDFEKITGIISNSSTDKEEINEDGGEATGVGDNNLSELYAESFSFKGVSVHRVKEVLERLAPGYRTILSLLLFEGYDYEEVSEILKIEESTVRSQYLRGRSRLIKDIESGR